MRKQFAWGLTLGLIVCLFAAGWAVDAQEKRQEDKPPADVLIERDVVVAVPVAPAEAGQQPAMPPAEVTVKRIKGRGGDEMTFSFISSEMSFDGNVVKGAPYSAEAVSESTQVLSDGNRITRKNLTKIYRDGEGRTRRDQELGAVGPFAMMGDPAQTVLINDPVAGVNYILDARSRVARKHAFPPRLGPAQFFPAAPVPVEGELAGPPAAPGAPQIIKRLRLRDGADASPEGVLKRVDPVYPPAAKASGARGPVMVKFTINEAGEVEAAEAVAGHPLLRAAAVDAIKQWRFKPTVVAGAATKVNGRMAFHFVLPGEEGDVRTHRELVPAVAANELASEPLGKQTIEGVEAEGTRTTMTIPANAIGNERPINVVTERWYSPELQVAVLVKRQDPRYGETIYRLTNINRAEPSRDLFEVPADYTVKEGHHSMKRRMKRFPE